MGLGSLSIGSFASYENTSSLVYLPTFCEVSGALGSMVSNAAGTAWNAARRILRATPPAAGPPRAGYLGLGDLGSEIWDPGLIQVADDPDPRIWGLGSRGSEDWDELRSGIRWGLGIPWDPGIQGSGDGIRGVLVGIRGRDRDDLGTGSEARS